MKHRVDGSPTADSPPIRVL